MQHIYILWKAAKHPALFFCVQCLHVFVSPCAVLSMYLSSSYLLGPETVFPFQTPGPNMQPMSCSDVPWMGEPHSTPAPQDDEDVFYPSFYVFVHHLSPLNGLYLTCLSFLWCFFTCWHCLGRSCLPSWLVCSGDDSRSSLLSPCSISYMLQKISMLRGKGISAWRAAELMIIKRLLYPLLT